MIDDKTKFAELMEWWSDAPQWSQGVLLVVVGFGAIMVWQLAVGGDSDHPTLSA